ncbi:hypothetical protein BD779DRAFT_1588076 [Infundibulicybe gibba]|nr:hypothetical protein BD779DRAFT_1588076 [Infundibulicybe gibba]
MKYTLNPTWTLFLAFFILSLPPILSVFSIGFLFHTFFHLLSSPTSSSSTSSSTPLLSCSHPLDSALNSTPVRPPAVRSNPIECS